MRLTPTELTIVKCVCHAKEPVTYKYLMTRTKLSFPALDKAIQKMIQASRIEVSPNGGFAITKLAMKNPMVRLVLQEMSEERLLITEKRANRRRKHGKRLLYSSRYFHTWAKKIKRLAVKIRKKK